MTDSGTGSPTHGPVFISFASHELELAERVVRQLEQGGTRCWIANRDIAPGASFPAAITAAVTGASAIVLLITEASNSSPHVLSEVELAFNARRPIVPVRLTPVALSADLQYFLGTTQWFDAGKDFDDADGERLRARLTSIIAGEPDVRPRPSEPRRSSPWIVYAVAAATLIAIAVGVWAFRRQQAPAITGVAPTPGSSAEVPTPSSTPVPAAPTAVAPSSSDAHVEEKKEAPASTLRTRINAQDGQPYVWIPPGRFTLGCSPGDSQCETDELPPHLARVSKGFWMGRTEITTAEYARGRRKTGPQTGTAPPGDVPVTGIAWADAKAYCAAVGGRLPSEKEWEYAARAGTTSSRYDVMPDIGWFEDNSNDRPHPVGKKTPNAFGLFDMLGNVYEWVADRYYNRYDDTDSDTIVEPLAGNASGVARGGSFTSEAKQLRASRRLELPPDAQESNVGFRCVADR